MNWKNAFNKQYFMLNILAANVFQWREMSVETFWMRPGVKRVMERALHCLYQTAMKTGTNQYHTTEKH